VDRWTDMMRLTSTFIHHHHHHQFLLSLMGHRASTKCHPLVLSLAILFTSLQLLPYSNASSWTDLHHVCLGPPLLLFLCGFQAKASLSMASFPFLSVCPVQVHFHCGHANMPKKYFLLHVHVCVKWYSQDMQQNKYCSRL
jgi:hypothetical protein